MGIRKNRRPGKVHPGIGGLHDFRHFVLNLHILKGVLLRNATENILFTAFLELASKKQFVEDVIGLCEVENDVKLADVTVVLVHLFDVTVDDFEGYELVVIGGAAGNEEKRGISAVDDLSVFILEEIAHPCSSGEDKLGYIFDDLGLFPRGECAKPLCKTDLALSREQNEVVDSH